MYLTLGLLQAVEIGFAFILLVIIAIFVVSTLLSAIKIVKEYERGVIFRLGRVQGRAKGPGLFILIPMVDKMVKIDLRTITMDVPPQDVITRDNVPARVNAVIYFRVTDPNKSVIEVENHVLATSQISQTTLRSVLGQKDLDDLLTNRSGPTSPPAAPTPIADDQASPVTVLGISDNLSAFDEATLDVLLSLDVSPPHGVGQQEIDVIRTLTTTVGGIENTLGGGAAVGAGLQQLRWATRLLTARSRASSEYLTLWWSSYLSLMFFRIKR
jgi:hypothetical protein